MAEADRAIPASGAAFFFRRRTLLAGLGLTAVALVARLLAVRAGLGGDALPVGPDAEDWVLATGGMAEGDWSLLQPNRYPLFPWLASLLVRLTGLSASGALLTLSLLASSLTPWATLAVARRLLPLPAAIAAGLWVALAPSQLLLGVSTIAYTLFALAFVGALAGLLDEHRWRGPALAAACCLVTVATLNQGLLCVLALLPAGLLLQRGWSAAAGLAGAALGLAAVHIAHPSPTSATRWMLRESMVYLSGNIPEETARVGGTYAQAFDVWAEQTLRLGGGWTAALLALGLWGLVAGLWRGRRDGSPLAPFLALGWAVAPAAILVPVMGSGHHLIHLIPLLAVAVAAGALALAPGRAGVVGGLAVAGLVGVLGVSSLAGAMRDLERRGDEGRAALQTAAAAVELIGEDGALIVPPTRPGDPAEIVFNIQWAFPPSMTVIQLGDLDDPRPIPPLDEATARGAQVAVVGALGDDHWAAGPYLFTGGQASKALPSRPGDTPQAMHLVTVSDR
jgi:hypothetical protein